MTSPPVILSCVCGTRFVVGSIGPNAPRQDRCRSCQHGDRRPWDERDNLASVLRRLTAGCDPERFDALAAR